VKSSTKKFWRECWYAFISQTPPLRPGETCCHEMLRYVVLIEHEVREVTDPDDVSIQTGPRYGLRLQRGEFVKINYCPWCGRRLPRLKKVARRLQTKQKLEGRR
jgi:hypothetical protein